MGIFDLFKKKETAQTKVQNTNVVFMPDGDLTHLTPEGNLPWGWHTHNKAITERINNEYTYFLNMWLDSQKQEPRKQYETLKSFILYIEDVERFCKSKDECFELWFNEILTSPGYLEQRKNDLKDIRNKLGV